MSFSHKKELLLSHPRLAMSDSFLVIVSSGQDEICTVCDVYNEMDEVCRYGKIGNGPGEFIQPLLTYAYGNTFGLRAEFAEKNDALLLPRLNVNAIKPFSESSYSRLSVINTSVGILDCILPKLS